MTENKSQEGRNSLCSMKANCFHSWQWCIPEFEDALIWINGHTHEIRRSMYLSDTPGKEVWRIVIPERYGMFEVVIKKYMTKAGYFETFEKSMALREALNYKILTELGVPTARVLACGETRLLGRVVESFIVTEYQGNTINGSTLMPGGALWDDQEMRMSFSRKTMDWLSIIHRHNFFHNACHPYKILISVDSPKDDPNIMLIDVAQADYKKHGNIQRKIASDLVSFFVDLRLSADAIKCLCAYYLDSNPHCGFTVESLWQALLTAE